MKKNPLFYEKLRNKTIDKYFRGITPKIQRKKIFLQNPDELDNKTYLNDDGNSFEKNFFAKKNKKSYKNLSKDPKSTNSELSSSQRFPNSKENVLIKSIKDSNNNTNNDSETYKNYKELTISIDSMAYKIDSKSKNEIKIKALETERNEKIYWYNSCYCSMYLCSMCLRKE